MPVAPPSHPRLAFPPKQKNHEPRPTRAGYLIETGAVPQRSLPVDAVGWEPVYDWDVGNPAQQREWCIPNVIPDPAPRPDLFPILPLADHRAGSRRELDRGAEEIRDQREQRQENADRARFEHRAEGCETDRQPSGAQQQTDRNTDATAQEAETGADSDWRACARF